MYPGLDGHDSLWDVLKIVNTWLKDLNLYRVYANRTHDPITARKFNSRNCLYSITIEASACNYFPCNPISAIVH